MKGSCPNSNLGAIKIFGTNQKLVTRACRRHISRNNCTKKNFTLWLWMPWVQNCLSSLLEFHRLFRGLFLVYGISIHFLLLLLLLHRGGARQRYGAWKTWGFFWGDVDLQTSKEDHLGVLALAHIMKKGPALLEKNHWSCKRRTRQFYKRLSCHKISLKFLDILAQFLFQKKKKKKNKKIVKK